MIYLFDRNQSLIRALHESQLLDGTIEDRLNTISIRLRTKNEKLLQGVDYVGVFDPDDDSNLFVFKVSRVSRNHEHELFGQHLLFDDLSGQIIEDIRPQKESVVALITRISGNSGWSIANYGSQKTYSGNFYYTSAAEALAKVVSDTGIEIRPHITYSGGHIAQKQLRIYDSYGSDTGRRFVDGVQGTKVIAEEERTPLYTALIGRGKGLEKTDEETGEWTGGYTRRLLFTEVVWNKPQKPLNKPYGQKYIESPEATTKYGYPDGTPRVGVVEFDQIEDPEELIQATYESLCELSRPKIQLKTERANAKGVHIGDKVVAIRGDLAFKTRIIEVVHHLKNKKASSYIFGDAIVSVSDQRFQVLKRQNEALEHSTDRYMQEMLKRIENAYWGEDGYNYDLRVGNTYQLPAGYYSFNKPINQNPTKVIYMGAGKMLIANSKKSDGTWNWKTAATGDGIYAQQVLADFIRGEQVQTGMLTSRTKRPNGEPVTSLDLDKGKFKTESADIYGALFVDSKKYSYRRYNVGEWLDKLESLIKDVAALQTTQATTIKQIKDLQDAQGKTISEIRQLQSTQSQTISEIRSLQSSQATTIQQIRDLQNQHWGILQAVRETANTAQSAADTAKSAAERAEESFSRFLNPPSNAHGLSTRRISRLYEVIGTSGTIGLEWYAEDGTNGHVWSRPDGT